MATMIHEFGSNCNSSGVNVVPVSTSWSGSHSFQLTIQKQTKEKSASYTCSTNPVCKLYVKLGHSCPFAYRVHQEPPAGSIVRVLAVFGQPEHLNDIVQLCPNHRTMAVAAYQSTAGAAAMATCGGDVSAASSYLCDSMLKSFVRVQHQQADYVTDMHGRISVAVPYERPQPGTDWVTLLLDFHCFSSCPGLNRRPILIVFTLELPGGGVIGRQSVEVRVCACPGRDRLADEKPSVANREEQGKRRSRSPSQYDVIYAAADNDDLDMYTLKVRGRQNYEILWYLNECMMLGRSKRLRLSDRLHDFIPRLSSSDHALQSAAAAAAAAPGCMQIQEQQFFDFYGCGSYSN